MNWLNPFSLALKTEWGIFLIALGSMIVLMFIIYIYIAYRKKQLEQLCNLEKKVTPYLSSELSKKGFSIVGSISKKFLRHICTVKDKEGQIFSCEIPFCTEQEKNTFTTRWKNLHNALNIRSLPIFGIEADSIIQENLISTIRKETIHSKEGLFIPLNEYILDKKLSEQEIESLLYKIANGLHALHQLQTEAGEYLYHGMLLPELIYIETNTSGEFRDVKIAGIGIPFGLSKKSVLISAKAMLSPARLKQILFLEEFQNRQTKVSYKTDFCLFGILAIELFTKQHFLDPSSIVWENVPMEWRPFLKKSISPSPHSRPENFAELKIALDEPELLNLFYSDPENEIESSSTETMPLTLDISILDAISSVNEAPKQTIELIAKAISGKKWKHGKKLAQQIIAQDKEDKGQALIYLAMCHYELGEKEQAEKCCKQAEVIDAHLYDQFIDHISKRI